MRAETSKGLRLDDIHLKDITSDQVSTVRRLVTDRATDLADEQTLLLMLGLAQPEQPAGPPSDPCANPECGVQMYRQHWPTEWKEGRVRFGGHGTCQRCRNKVHNANKDSSPTTPKRRRRNRS